MKSPLQLDRYFFTKVSIEAQAECDHTVAPVVSAQVEFAQEQENPRKWMVKLRVGLEPQEENIPRYLGTLEAVGFFTVDEHWPDDKVESLASINGASVLYGAVREMVCNVTSRGPWAAVTIDTLSFASMLQQEPKVEDSGQQPRRKPTGGKPTKRKKRIRDGEGIAS